LREKEGKKQGETWRKIAEEKRGIRGKILDSA
jgi:hypothetical protein